MPICAALLLHGFDNFNLYVLEVVESTHTNPKGFLVADRSLLLTRENYFAKLIKPSYNVADILNPFVGSNHPSFGVPKSQATKDKIRDTLTGRKQTEIEIENHRKGAKKKPLYCYDFITQEFIVNFESIRAMARLLNITPIEVQRKIDNNKPFKCNYNENTHTWLIKSKKD